MYMNCGKHRDSNPRYLNITQFAHPGTPARKHKTFVSQEKTTSQESELELIFLLGNKTNAIRTYFPVEEHVPELKITFIQKIHLPTYF